MCCDSSNELLSYTVYTWKWDVQWTHLGFMHSDLQNTYKGLIDYKDKLA